MHSPNEPAIEAIGLTRRYGERLAVDNVGFAVARGEIFGFLGPNGAGKSTTTRMLTGFLTPSGGTVRVTGLDLATDAVSARQHIGVVPEEANVYADLTVWQNVMLMAELHGVGRRDRNRRGTELLEQFGLADRRGQKGRDLSKGLRQRLMLCAALVSEPEILFLDEPTSGLDVSVQARLLDLIRTLVGTLHIACIVVTHDLGVVRLLTHRLMVMRRGRVVEQGLTDQVLDDPQHPYSQLLVSSILPV